MEATHEVPEQPVVNITGEKVLLGPIRRDLLTLYQRWDNDFEVALFEDATARPSARESTERWYQRAGSGEQQDEVFFTIYERATLRPIGRTALREINHHHRTATFSIGIGEKDCWGKGYGTEATSLMLDYAFTYLGLHSILLFVFAFNERAIRAYRRAGFREVGRRREAVRLGDQVHDVMYMDCLATEFRGTALRRLLPAQ